MHRRSFLTALLGAITLRGAGEDKFDAASFRNPPVEHYPSAFWGWNDAIPPERIREQLADMHAHRLFTVCIEPLPTDFRPENTGNRLDVEYLSPEYFERYRLAMEETKRLGMQAWLYDEGGWPSGGATGRVVKANPAFGQQTLVAERRPLASGEVPATPEGAVASFVENGSTLVVCRVRRDTFQPDRMNTAATREFIRITHERYRQAMPEYFGSVIRWAFTDEPAVSPFRPGRQMPWTEALPRIFREKKGYDLIASLPLLLNDPPLTTPEAIGARVDFFDVWSQLFHDSYLVPIRDWCRQHGILSGGHMGGDDETMASANHGYGHILRSMRGMDLPGVDAIWRQLFPDQRNHHFPRYAGSVAHQQGASRVLTESFGVYGNGLTMAEMKWLINYQYVRGANMLVMVEYPVGTSGNLMPGERPHLGPESPLWRHQALLQDYTARLGYALCQGQPDVDVAVYFPVRDFWAGAPSRATPESLAQDDVVLELEKRQVDFDFVDDDLLDESSGKDGRIRVGPMTYRILIVSPARMLPDRTATAMARFVRNGGTLVFAGEVPSTGPQAKRSFLEHLGTSPLRLGERRKIGKGRAVLCAISEVGLHTPAVITLDPPAESLRATARRTESGRIIVVTNESRQWVTTNAKLPGGSSVKQLDLESGEITTAGRELTLPPWGEVCLLVGEDSGPAAERQLPNTKTWKEISGDWQIRPVEQVIIEDDDFAWRKLPEDPWRAARLGDWKELVGADFSGVAEYRIRFEYAGANGDERFLDLGEVAAAAEVWLNDVHLGARAWQPYWFQTASALRHGGNELRIQVTNTLANYLVSPAVRASWAAKKGPGWPGPYDQRANSFERQSTTSGLFGPVRITSRR